MRLKYDFADLSHSELFPAHGWSENSQGVKLLWLPILRELRQWPAGQSSATGGRPVEHGHFVRQVDPSLSPDVDQAVTIEMRGLSGEPLEARLRDLVELLALLQNNIKRLEGDSLVPDAGQRVGLFLRWAFIDVRCLLDLLALQLRARLFERPDQFPVSFSTLLKKRPESVLRAKPRVPPEELLGALSAADDWFWRLRDPDGGHQGIRDALVHGSLRIMISVQQSGPHAPRACGILSSGKRRPVELLQVLRDVVNGLCALLTRLTLAMGRLDSYDGTVSTRAGSDEDLTGLWPHIAATHRLAAKNSTP